VEDYNDTPNSMLTNDYEEYEEKYHNVDYDKESSIVNIPQLRPLPLFNTKFCKNGSFYVDTKSLPRINDNIYREIERFPEYDYINSIAYEMLIRTNEFNALHQNMDLSRNEKIKAYDKLGVDLKEIESYGYRKISSYYNQNDTNQAFANSYCNHITIDDIDDGLGKLIHFYLTKKQIFKIIKHEKNSFGLTVDIQYEVDFNVTFDEVNALPLEYNIPAKFDYENYESKYKMIKISQNIPLLALEDEFLAFIEEDIPNSIKSLIQFNSTRPLLKFKESAIFEIPINFNLSQKNIMEFITKLKNEYDSENMKTPINYLYNKNFKIEDWKRDALFQVTKKSIAKAFFVYDLFQEISLAVLIEKNGLKKLKEEDIEKIITVMNKKIEESKIETSNLIKYFFNKTKNDKKLTTKEKKDSIQKQSKKHRHDLKQKKIKINKEKDKQLQELNKTYKMASHAYHLETVLTDIVQKHNISSYMCKQYLKFMRKYIDNLKYKELIIGSAIQN
jgi:hypothetical protein